MLKLWLLALLVLVVEPFSVYAQERATLDGIVTDESMGVMSGVTVTATDLANGR